MRSSNDTPVIGSVVLATDQGLGYLAKAFFDNGIIQKVLIHPHTSRKNHYEWYPDTCLDEVELFEGIDTLLFFETPFDWRTIVRAREKGIKTVLIPMYECTKFPFPYEPDLILFPSELDRQFYQKNGKEGVSLQIPVDVPFKSRKKARVFVHNAGNGGLGGRNGTQELIKAMEYVQSPIKLIIRSQVPIKGITDPRIDLRVGQFPKIWSEGDVFIFPEKFNGLSLPLQEAYASGMLVMAGARFPMFNWLPNEPLIPVSRYTRERIAVEFDCAHYEPVEIARHIDAWYGRDIREYSLKGKKWAEQNSWKRLKNQLLDALK